MRLSVSNEPAGICYTGTHGGRFLGWRKSPKYEQKFIYEIPEFSPPYPPKYAVFRRISRNCVRLDYSYSYARKIAHPTPSKFRFFTGQWAFFAPIHSNWALKTPKSSYLLWTHCPIMAQNIVIPRRQEFYIAMPRRWDLIFRFRDAWNFILGYRDVRNLIRMGTHTATSLSS